MNIEEGPGQGHPPADRPLHLCQDDTDKGLRQQTLGYTGQMDAFNWQPFETWTKEEKVR